MRQFGCVTALVVMLWVTGCAHSPSPAEAPTAPVISPAAPLPGVSAADRPFRSAAEDPKDGPCIRTTHGCMALNPDVDEDTIDHTICQPGYTKIVRPATSYTNGVKKKLLRDAGLDAVHCAGLGSMRVAVPEAATSLRSWKMMASSTCRGSWTNR